MSLKHWIEEALDLATQLSSYKLINKTLSSPRIFITCQDRPRNPFYSFITSFVIVDFWQSRLQISTCFEMIQKVRWAIIFVNICFNTALFPQALLKLQGLFQWLWISHSRTQLTDGSHMVRHMSAYGVSNGEKCRFVILGSRDLHYCHIDSHRPNSVSTETLFK
jgi:hypothetical protein